MINILLNGCNGCMGKAMIQYINNIPDFNILYGIDKSNADLFSRISKKPDVIIDFSTVSATFTALNYAVENLVPIVIATTGFSQTDNKKIHEFSEAIPIFKSSNMSYAIHLFSDIASIISKKLIDMDIEIIEKHHNHKKDAPSGTALMIANNINKKNGKKYKFVFDRSSSNSINSNNCRTKNEIGFSSVRGGNLVGEHTILFLGKNESIEITHTAYSRDIYIEGALKAAKFIISKKNGLFSMEDLL